MAFKINVKILCNILIQLVDYQKRLKNTSLILTSIPILTHFKIYKSKSSKQYCDTLKTHKVVFSQIKTANIGEPQTSRAKRSEREHPTTQIEEATLSSEERLGVVLQQHCSHNNNGGQLPVALSTLTHFWKKSAYKLL